MMPEISLNILDVAENSTRAKASLVTIIVDAQCTDSFDKGLHQKVLDVLEGFQVKVTGR